MSCANQDQRVELIRGFRGIADYLESNPQVPAPIYSTVYAFPVRGNWAEMCAEIDVTAASLGVVPGMTDGGHYIASRDFGPVEYRAVAIPPEREE